MPNVVDYSLVLDRMIGDGYRSLYFNSGAFGFPTGTAAVSRGWIGPPDSSIRESARRLVRHAKPPFDLNLTRALMKLWKWKTPDLVWAMPKSHWAYELEFGHRDWLPDVLKKIGVDPAKLAPLNNAAAVEFTKTDEKPLGYFVKQLLAQLVTSDFELVFLGQSTICTIHTRSQLWWTTTDKAMAKQLDLVMPAEADGNSDT